MAPINNVISLYGLYEVYYKGVYVGTCRTRSCAGKLMAALKEHPGKTSQEVINLLKKAG